MDIAHLLASTSSTLDDMKNHSLPVRDGDLMSVWENALCPAGFHLRPTSERNTLTDALLVGKTRSCEPMPSETPVHVKIIGRHTNGSFRCHIGTGKASRPIQSVELCQQMRLLAVFFRSESSKCQDVSPEFILFPTWLLHLFRYTEHGTTPGRTDVRFLENAAMAKEDHIYRLNHVLNTLFRFHLFQFDHTRFCQVVQLANFLFDSVGLGQPSLPSPRAEGQLPLYRSLLALLRAPRPAKPKPVCINCSAKPASRRKLCVACYRYQLKHNMPRPLRLIVASQPGPRTQDHMIHHDSSRSKACANCGVKETHQWYRNLSGSGHWCETCKSYYLRHTKVRPPELFVKAAKRKVDIRSFFDDKGGSTDHDEKKSKPRVDPMEAVLLPTRLSIARCQPSLSKSNSILASPIPLVDGFGPHSGDISPISTTTLSPLSPPTTPPPFVSHYPSSLPNFLKKVTNNTSVSLK